MAKMKMTTLCYIECGGKVLMMYRNKKQNDQNEGKWIGIGGALEEGESPEEGMVREVREETGIELSRGDWRFCGIISFVSYTDGAAYTEYMFLYSAHCGDTAVTDCNEGTLAWIDAEKLGELPMWQGDRIFLELMRVRHEFFSLKLIYNGNDLAGAVLDGENISIK